MNTLTTNPYAGAIARQTIADRVHAAEVRRVARAVRLERRTAGRALGPQAPTRPLPRWRIHFLRPAH